MKFVVSEGVVECVNRLSAVFAEHTGADPAPFYARYYLDVAAHLAALYPVCAGIGVGRGSRVVEIGSGLGTRCLLGNAFFGAHFTGIEPCADSYSSLGGAIAELRRANPHLSYTLQEGCGELTGLDDKSQDFVLSFEVMEHVRDPRAVLREMYRVLKPGGKLYLTTCNYASFYEGHYRCLWLPFLSRAAQERLLKARGFNPRFLAELSFVTKRSLLGDLQMAGFSKIRTGVRYEVASVPALEVVHPPYDGGHFSPRVAPAQKVVCHPAVSRALAFWDREYKLYVEAEKC